MSLFLISMGLSAAIVAGSAVCGWIACWLWTTRTRRTPPQIAAAGGLRRPDAADDAALQAVADDALRTRHRPQDTARMWIHPANHQVPPIRIPAPRDPFDLTVTAETVLVEVVS